MKNALPLLLGGIAAFFLMNRGASASGPSANGTKISSDGINIIKKFEGFEPLPYDDGGIMAIGYGTTKQSDVSPALFDGRPITEAQATELLYQHIQRNVDPPIDRLVTFPINQNQRDALASLIYNIGQGNFANSTVLRELNQGNIPEAADAFLLWNKAGGAVSPGLVNRRSAERSLFLGNPSTVT